MELCYFRLWASLIAIVLAYRGGRVSRIDIVSSLIAWDSFSIDVSTLVISTLWKNLQMIYAVSSTMLTRLSRHSILARISTTSALLNFHTSCLLICFAPLPTSTLDYSCSNACLYWSRGPFSIFRARIAVNQGLPACPCSRQ
jgi:hypothetical protein